MKRHSCFVIVGIVLLAGIQFPAWKVTEAQAQKVPEANEYVIEVNGTEGVQLDMLLITKPTANEIPMRETARITVPYAKKFSAAKCFAWLDTLPKNGSGKQGDKYHIVLKRNGKPPQRAVPLFGGHCRTARSIRTRDNDETRRSDEQLFPQLATKGGMRLSGGCIGVRWWVDSKPRSS